MKVFQLHDGWDGNQLNEFLEVMAVIQAVILFFYLGGSVYTLHKQHIENKHISTLNLIIYQRSNDKLNSVIDIVGKLARHKGY